MKRPIKVVMLPTEDDSVIYANEKGAPGLYSTYAGIKVGQTQSNQPPRFQNQHLYITVSQDVEPIKEGDWYYDDVDNKVYKCIGVDDPVEGMVYCNDNGVNKERAHKIIATTDPKLFTLADCPTRGSDSSVKYILPQLQQSFLKEYVANPEGEWEIEYEDDSFIHVSSMAFGSKVKGKLKLNQNNTVNITAIEPCEHPFTRLHQVEDIVYCNKCNTPLNKSIEEKMYSREEVEVLCKQFKEDTRMYSTSKLAKEFGSTLTIPEIEEKWIKKNL